jgi:branched-chain amino acid transport system substrate-binding protein
MRTCRVCGFRLESIAATAFIIASLTIVGCQKTTSEEIVIGAVLPLTGDAALAGTNTKMGVDLAVEIVNAQGGINGKKIRVRYEDSMADAKTGVSGLNKLISIDAVPYVIDNSISTVTLAMAPIAEKNKVVLLATGASSPKISEAGDFVFRIWNSDLVEGDVVERYAADSLGLKKVGVLYANNDYGVGLKDVFARRLSEAGLQPSSVESFDAGAPEFKASLTKSLVGKPEAIYLVGYSKDCIKIFQEAREMGYKGIWLGTTVMLDPSVLEAAKAAAYSVYFPEPMTPDTTLAPVAEFRKAFFSKFQKEPPALADVGYDAVMLFREASRIGKGITGTGIQEGLSHISGFSGASGLISFDQNGDVHKPLSIVLAK